MRRTTTGVKKRSATVTQLIVNQRTIGWKINPSTRVLQFAVSSPKQMFRSAVLSRCHEFRASHTTDCSIYLDWIRWVRHWAATWAYHRSVFERIRRAGRQRILTAPYRTQCRITRFWLQREKERISFGPHNLQIRLSNGFVPWRHIGCSHKIIFRPSGHGMVPLFRVQLWRIILCNYFN